MSTEETVHLLKPNGQLTDCDGQGYTKERTLPGYCFRSMVQISPDHKAKGIKTKLGVLLQKPESAFDLIIPYPEKPEKTIKAPKPSVEEALQWRDSLDKLLDNSYGLTAFRSFLKSEFSEENVEFWVACEDYKKTKSPAKMSLKAQKIYEEFIQTEAPREVNIDHFTKAVTLKNLVEPSPTSFDLAQKKIHALMEKDSLPRFLRSDLYLELIE